MKDNKLIELAARAVGPKVVRKVECSGGFELVELSCGLRWNPLEDDGAALRLAVRLGLFDGPKFFHFRSLERFAGQDADDYTANRRAIVRAAAEVGKSMQP